MQSRPVISPADLFYWNAFWDLIPERQPNGLIPASCIMAYADRFNVPYHGLRYIIDGMEQALRELPRV